MESADILIYMCVDASEYYADIEPSDYDMHSIMDKRTLGWCDVIFNKEQVEKEFDEYFKFKRDLKDKELRDWFAGMALQGFFIWLH